MLRCKGYARCFFFVAGLLRSKLRQAGYGEETAFVPQACITARKTMKTGWRGPCPYKPTKPIRLTCPLRAANLPGSGPPMRKSVFKVWGDSLSSWFGWDSLFSRFGFGSASASGKGGFAVCGGRRRLEAKPLTSLHPRKRQRALGLDADTRGFLGFGFKN